MKKYLEKAIHKVFENALVFELFRKVVHKDFLTEKNIIKKEISLSSGQKVLDLGCGIGQFSVLFEYNNYVGADIDKACIERARKLYSNKKFVLLYEKDTKLPFEDKSFDYILLADTIHHLSDELLHFTLRESKRILKPSGKLIILDLLPPKQQPTMLGRLVFGLDRGKYARDINISKKIISMYLEPENSYFIDTSIFKFKQYVISASV